MSLTWEWSGRLLPALALFRCELRTAEQQTVASGDWFADRLRVGEGRFSRKRLNSARHSLGSWPGLAEAYDLNWRDYLGHFTAGTTKRQMPGGGVGSQHVDEKGMPVLYASGLIRDRRACARIGFPDQRWLRFLVRGTRKANAIMTAVDQAGNKIARYRRVAGMAKIDPRLEITIHPDQKLTDELVLAIAISARWLGTYFDTGA